ncbi:hypothetical protein ACO1O0_002327 [Amphichorda felina]
MSDPEILESNSWGKQLADYCSPEYPVTLTSKSKNIFLELSNAATDKLKLHALANEEFTQAVMEKNARVKMTFGQMTPTKATAAMIQLFGSEMPGDRACRKCRDGNGRFKECVVDPAMGSGCGNCMMQNNGSGCSHYKPHSGTGLFSGRPARPSPTQRARRLTADELFQSFLALPGRDQQRLFRKIQRELREDDEDEDEEM